MKKYSTRISGKKKPVKKRKVFNANYPPEDVSQEELKRFWGEPNPKEDDEFVKSLRSQKVKGKEYKPCPL